MIIFSVVLGALNLVASVLLLAAFSRLINVLTTQPIAKQECAWTIEFGKDGLIVGKESEGEE